ncbi:MAG: carbon storage regulator [Acidithiobacillus sp.]
MLVLTRRRGQAICIGDNIRIVITRIEEGQVRLGIECTDALTILREELLETVREANQSAQTAVPAQLDHWLQHHDAATSGSSRPKEDSNP